VRLRILLITPWFHPAHGFGGTVQRLEKTSKYLSEWGHRIVVLTTDAVTTGVFDRALPRIEVINNTTIYRFHGFASIRQFFLTPSMLRTAMKIATSSDIIHACGMRNFQTDVSLLTSLARRRPLVIQGFASVPIHQEPDSIREPILKLAHNGFTAKAEFRLADSYIAASKFERDAFIEAGVSPDKIELIPSGADLEEFEWGGSRGEKISVDGPQTILFVGRINIIKGLEVLLRAFKEVSASFSGVRLVVAGVDQGYGHTLQALMAELEIDNLVTWVRNPKRGDIAKLMHSCEMLVLPSYVESNPIVIHEAGACAKPVIASRVGGIPEVIEDGKNGLLVPKGDSSSLAAAMMRILRSPSLAKMLGQNLQKQVLTKYNWAVVARITEGLYYKLVSQTSKTDIRMKESVAI